MQVTNADDDRAGMRVQQYGRLTDEQGQITARFTVGLLSQPAFPVIIPLRSDDDTEGVCSKPSLTFDAKNWKEEQVVIIRGVDDFIDDGNMTYNVLIGPCQTDDFGYTGLHHSLSLTTTDDDTLGIHLNVIEEYSTEWGREASFEITLESEPTAPVLFSISSTDMTEGIVDTALLVMAADNWNIGRLVKVVGQADAQDDGDFTYAVAVAPMITQDENYLKLPVARVWFTNKDDTSNLVKVFARYSECVTSEDGQRVAVVKVSVDYWHSLPQEQAYEYVEVIAESKNPEEGSVSTQGPSAQGSAIVPSQMTSTFVYGAGWDKAAEFYVYGVDDVDVDGTTPFNVTLSARVKIVGVKALKPVTDRKVNSLLPIICENEDDDRPGFVVTRTGCVFDEGKW